MSDHLKVSVDGIEVEVAPGTSIMQACEEAGAEIPRFCYHERLSVAGNCRMCLVNVKGAPKPVASCAMPVAPDMEIDTKSEAVQTARKGVMEFLLINHPLDCPICDQGGECDLQDQAYGYGHDDSRFADNKRAVEDKEMGPLVKTIMTRCIQCTRCVRFSTEVAGVPEIGAIGRGENMEITTYLEASLSSELSGNVIDLCPVGALTSKPYAFTARPWELKKTETIDVMDAVGSNIRVDTRGREVMRILPRNNDEINEEWLSDKSRFIWDGLNRQRLDTPYVRSGKSLKPVSWDEAFAAIAKKVKGKEAKTAAIAGDLACAEGMFALKGLMESLGSADMDCRQDGAKLSGPRANYIFNTTIAGIEEADALLIIGSNPRKEAPVLNARIRKRWLQGDFPVANIGVPTDLTYEVEQLGAGTDTLVDLVAGKNSFFDVLKKARRPMLIIGQSALSRQDGYAILAQVIQLAEATGMMHADWNGFNVLHQAAARVAGLDLGFVPGEGGRDVAGILEAAEAGDVETVFLLGADEIDFSRLAKAFTVYIGSHGDAGAHAADVILPAAAFTEKSAIYVNTEGRVQMTEQAAFPPGDAREDWKILRALSEHIGDKLPYDNLNALRTAMFDVVPYFAALDDIAPSGKPEAGATAKPDMRAFEGYAKDFYLTNPVCRASAVMAECSQQALEREQGTGTDG
ncbi:MAG: NADH-quinone oxidoreductase subunit NuoG [Parvibaculales bacterium]